MFPERFSNLPAYAFPRLRTLLDAHEPGGPVIHMSIGEPKHPFPDWVTEVIAENAHEFGKYPTNERAAVNGFHGLQHAFVGHALGAERKEELHFAFGFVRHSNWAFRFASTSWAVRSQRIGVMDV